MQTFPVTFSRNYVVVLILIIIPLAITAIVLSLVLSTPNLPDWLVLASSFGLIGLSILAVLFTIKKWGSIPATISMDETGLTIKLLRYSPFYPRREYSSTWDGLENVSTNFDTQHDKRFYLISFRQPAATVSLDPGNVTDADTETPFGQVLFGYVEQYNATHTTAPETLIHKRGFYDAWWAKLLTVLAYAMLVTAIVMYFTNSDTMPLWRLVQVLSFSILWLVAYHTNRRRAKA